MSFVRAIFHAAIAAAVIFSPIQAASAAGAIAIGACAAYGFAYERPTAEDAQAEALKNCEGNCKQVVTTKKGCIAFAVDGRKPCGPLGFANANRLGEAQNTALKYCYKHGGKDCMIRAWICDTKSSANR